MCIINHQLQGILITPDIISDCVKQLNKGKDDGNHRFKSHHSIQGGHRLYTYLSILFNTMIKHGYNPRELLLSSIILIRGISLFNAICKVYDHAIIFLCYNKFITSDMQFGFKANHSTIMCSSVFHEIINHYLKMVVMYIVVY